MILAGVDFSGLLWPFFIQVAAVFLLVIGIIAFLVSMAIRRKRANRSRRYVVRWKDSSGTGMMEKDMTPTEALELVNNSDKEFIEALELK